MINLVKDKYKPVFIFLILPIVVPLILFYVYNSYNYVNLELYTINGNTMGTTYSIQIYSKDVNVNKLKLKVENVLDLINKSMSTYDNTSELSQINNNLLQDSIKISDELLNVLTESLHISEISNGYYDCTVFPLVELWNFGPDINSQVIPTSIEISEAKDRVDYTKIIINDSNLIKVNSDLTIDLSSIAKGYAVDRISELLIDLGYYNFAVEIGGEWIAHGKNKDGNYWNILVNNFNFYENPVIYLDNNAVATSGTYHNYFVYEGIEYSHIINPKTGYPIENNILSTTIISNNCMKADGLATMSMVINDPQKAIKIIENEGAHGLIIVKNSDGTYIEYESMDFDKFIVKQK